jgi:hypothetical protein
MSATLNTRFLKSLRAAAAVPALCLSLALSGCYTSYSDEVPGISYQTATPVKVTAGRIDISNAYNATMSVPYVEHTFRVTPAAAVQELVRRQIVATEGNTQVLRVIVEDASVRQSTLPKPEGVIGMVQRAPDEKFDSRIALRFELAEEAAPDVIIGRAQVVATRERILKGGATLAERDREYQDLTQALVNDLAQGIATTVQNTFGYK